MQAAEIDLGRVAQDLQLKRKQIEAAVQLLDEGNTVPFITRYRKELTGGLDEEQIRAVQRRVGQLRQLAERRQTILRSIESQGKLTDELRAAIVAAPNARRLEDLYLPFKPRKQTLATVARQRGLGPLAEAIWNRDPIAANLQEVLPGVVDPEKQLATVDDVVVGLKYIIAELISEQAEVRDVARRIVWQGGIASTKIEPAVGEAQSASASAIAVETEKSKTDDNATATASAAATETAGESTSAPIETDEEGEVLVSFVPEVRATKDVAAEFRNFFDYSEPVEKIPPHRIMALNRGEKLGVLKLKIEVNRQELEAAVLDRLQLADHPHRDFIVACVPDAIDRLMLRSLEREVRTDLTDFAEDHAVGVFVKNLRNLLLQPPIHGRRVLAIDPGYRTGCKFAAIDEYGNLLEHGVMFPHATKKPAKKRRPRPAFGTKPKLVLEPVQAAGEFASELLESSGESPSAEPVGASDAAPVFDSEAHKPIEAPVMAADAVHRSTPEESEPPAITEGEGSLEAIAAQLPANESDESPATAESLSDTTTEAAVQEVQKLWREVGPKPAVSPAWFGVVLPTPDDVEERIAKKKRIKAAKVEGSHAQPATSPQLSRREQVKRQMGNLCKRLGIGVIAIGNGAACRETEEMVAELLGEGRTDGEYVIVNEAGASVYSTNVVGREEFPQFDATTRGTISIGRRLQDPLSELVKIDPHSLGVGLYQHDVGQRRLRESLGEVVESCVNYVGVDVNTASASLLQYVSGLNQSRARAIVEHRQTHGPFKNRNQIKDVNGIGPVVFTQAAGFLRIPGGEEPLDATWIHPESYEAATKVLTHFGFATSDLVVKEKLDELKAKLVDANPAEIAAALSLSEPFVGDILRDLARPGRDPREDLPPPIFKKGVLKLEDLSENMRLQGTVLNVVDFGAFVDIGLKDSGLVHISQLANRFIRSPHEAVSVGDVVTVWVMKIDRDLRRVSLSMIEPGTDRPAQPRRQERRPERRPPRPQQRPNQGADGQVQGQVTQVGDPSQARPALDRRPQNDRDRPQQQRGGQGGRPQQRGGPDQRRYGQQQGGQGQGGRPAPRRDQSNSDRQNEAPVKRRPPPKPVTLTPDALAGKEDLRSFGELREFFKVKKPPGDEGGKQSK